MNQFPFHIPVHQLPDGAEDRLSLTQRLQLKSHLVVCGACSSKAVHLKHQRDSMRTDASDATSPTFIAGIKQCFHLKARPPSTLLERQRIRAMCHFDSLDRTVSFGVRSGKPATRQLLFRNGENEIDLRIEPAGTLWKVADKILGDPVVKGRVLLHSPASTMQADLNELSEFSFSSVEAGTYKMILDLENLKLRSMN